MYSLAKDSQINSRTVQTGLEGTESVFARAGRSRLSSGRKAWKDFADKDASEPEPCREREVKEFGSCKRSLSMAIKEGTCGPAGGQPRGMEGWRCCQKRCQGPSQNLSPRPWSLAIEETLNVFKEWRNISHAVCGAV